MSTADDLLRRVLEETDGDYDISSALWNAISEYLDAPKNADKNLSESINSEKVNKSTQKRLAIQKAKKPMPPEKRSEAYIELEGVLGPDAHLMSFLSGICEAERFHGIGGGE